MTREQFVQRICRAAYEPAVSGTVALLRSPPGRNPRASLVRLSEWFHHLSGIEQQALTEVLELAAEQAIFGVLAVLDGARSILEAGEAGALELRLVTEEGSALLNDSSGVPLHDLFTERVAPR